MGILPLAGWFTKFDGYVFNDTNRNGKRDAGEPGVPNFGLTLRKRENSLMDRGSTAGRTDQSGHYVMEQAYPLRSGSSSRRTTTATTRPASPTRPTTSPTPTTVLGQGVDVSVLPIIGLSGTLDWGVHAYDASGANGVDPQNGGIVGSISYDTTRNELDPQYAAAEDWQPGVSGRHRRALGADRVRHRPPDSAVRRATATTSSPPTAHMPTGKLLNTYVSETWERPTDCVPRNVDGDPLRTRPTSRSSRSGPARAASRGP